MSEGNWETLKVDADYEINNLYPHQIRRKSNQRIISESLEKPRGYLICHLNRKKYDKHRVIALQWLDNHNPDKYKCVDHVNHNRLDNRLENLRWTTYTGNNNNRFNQTFVDKLPDDAIVVDKYNEHTFENLYFHDDVFYFYNGINYTIKEKQMTKWGLYRIRATDMNGERICIYYSKFKREYGLI